MFICCFCSPFAGIPSQSIHENWEWSPWPTSCNPAAERLDSGHWGLLGEPIRFFMRLLVLNIQVPEIQPHQISPHRFYKQYWGENVMSRRVITTSSLLDSTVELYLVSSRDSAPPILHLLLYNFRKRMCIAWHFTFWERLVGPYLRSAPHLLQAFP